MKLVFLVRLTSSLKSEGLIINFLSADVLCLISCKKHIESADCGFVFQTVHVLYLFSSLVNETDLVMTKYVKSSNQAGTQSFLWRRGILLTLLTVGLYILCLILKTIL
jgi:hypothetical protein